MYGVEIHPGNGPLDTKGCILPGTKQTPKNPDWVGNDSYHEAFSRIMKIVTDTQNLDKWNGDTTTLTVTHTKL
jgi:hypothetical protein